MGVTSVPGWVGPGQSVEKHSDLGAVEEGLYDDVDSESERLCGRRRTLELVNVEVDVMERLSTKIVFR
jgi:hypothetical protein